MERKKEGRGGERMKEEKSDKKKQGLVEKYSGQAPHMSQGVCQILLKDTDICLPRIHKLSSKNTVLLML